MPPGSIQSISNIRCSDPLKDQSQVHKFDLSRINHVETRSWIGIDDMVRVANGGNALATFDLCAANATTKPDRKRKRRPASLDRRWRVALPDRTSHHPGTRSMVQDPDPGASAKKKYMYIYKYKYICIYIYIYICVCDTCAWIPNIPHQCMCTYIYIYIYIYGRRTPD
jgi:hypothetical protein